MQTEVLLVDDEKHITTALSRVMRQAGIKAATASSGEEALQWLESNSAELILSDYQMPGITGTELLAKVEAKWPSTVRIILSAHSDFDTVLNAVHTGVVHKFLAKPWNNEELVEHIKTALASQRTQATKQLHEEPEYQSQNGVPDPDASTVQLQVILDTVIDGIVTINPNGIIVSANASIEHIFGYTPQEILGKNVSLLMPEPYRSQHDHYLKQYSGAEQSGIIGNQRRLVGLRKNGEVFPIELSVNSMQIAGKTQFLGMIRDITGQVSAESQTELLLNALEVAQDGVALFGAGDKLIHCNQQFKSLYESLGVTVNDGVSYKGFFQSCLEQGLFCSEQDDPTQWLNEQLKIHKQLPISKEYELKPGQWIDIHETQADNGSVIVSHLDITKQKQTQLSLADAVQQAELANSARGRFLAMMSHEIRTPLNGVLGLLQLLEETPLNEKQQQYVTHALNSGRGLMTIISDILDFSKIDADKLELINRPCQLSSLVADLQQLFSLRVEEKSINFSVSLDKSLPAWIWIDGQRLRQVLLNLISNAIKFTDYGEVKLMLSHKNGSLTCLIQDTGMGIPLDEQDKIFSEFATISNAAEKQVIEGTGLGLAICQKLVCLMGGSIDFSSVPQQGSRFWFELPLLPCEAETTTVERFDERVSGQVLVIDDSQTNLLVARTMLESLGLDVTCASNGVEAIDLYKVNHFDLILLDISMPIIDGYETSRRLRQLTCWRDTPIIAFTAYALAEDKARFKDAGMRAHLEKPLEKAVLKQIILPFFSEQPDFLSHELESFTAASDEEQPTDLIDLHKLDALAADTSEEVLPELVAIFNKDVRSRIIELANSELNPEDTERHLHTIGSSALMYGLIVLSQQARALEAKCQKGLDVSSDLNSFIKVAKNSIDALECHLVNRNKKPQ